MQKKTTVDYGRELEQYVANKFIEVGYKKARRSRGSGNKGELGDIAGQEVAVAECKHYNKPNITIKESVWKKLKSEIPLHSNRFPMYVLQNGGDMRLVCLEVDDFFRILHGFLDARDGMGTC
jgi:hypothetical protein